MNEIPTSHVIIRSDEIQIDRPFAESRFYDRRKISEATEARLLKLLNASPKYERVMEIETDNTVKFTLMDTPPKPYKPMTEFERGMMMADAQEWRRHHREMEKRRRDGLLNAQLVELVKALSQALDDHAGALAANRESPDAFSTDEAKFDLLWRLNEYLSQGLVEDEFYDMMAKPWQLTQMHVMSWIDMTVLG